MIEIKNVTKKFDDITAVNDISLKIKEKETFGLIGTNGAGKSTLLRMMSNVFNPDRGEIIIDGENVRDNEKIKEKLFFISDEQYFPNDATPISVAKYMNGYYKTFDMDMYTNMLSNFGLNPKRRIRTFSKGMKKQVSMILALSANTPYILCDETFDGLDPVMRQAVKSLIAESMIDRGVTAIISSHNLRELEDICDTVGLLHKGGILLSEELDSLKLNLHKIQCVLGEDKNLPLSDNYKIINKETRGSLLTLTIEGNLEDINRDFRCLEPVFFECIPLTLEEIFISKTMEVGYDVKSIIF